VGCQNVFPSDTWFKSSFNCSWDIVEWKRKKTSLKKNPRGIKAMMIIKEILFWERKWGAVSEKARKSEKASNSLRRRAYARNVSFRISLRWPIHIIKSVDKIKLAYYTSHRRSTTVSLETCPSELWYGWAKFEGTPSMKPIILSGPWYIRKIMIQNRKKEATRKFYNHEQGQL